MAQSIADPADVHPEYDRPTPENLDEWSEEQLEEWDRRNEAKLLGEVRERREELQADQEAALDALRSPEREDYGEAEVDDLTFKVKTHASSEIEDALAELSETQEGGVESAGDLQQIRREVPPLMAWFIVEPEEYADPAVWRGYADRFGIGELTKAWLRIVEPYLDENEQDRAVQKFRSLERRRSTR